MLSLEGVGEAVCFGVPDDKYGEIVWGMSWRVSIEAGLVDS